MKHLEQLSESLRELTDRYGITITEVPERLREKILNKVGADAAADLDVILQPLLANLLRPLRIRAGQRVDKNVVAETVGKIAELEHYDVKLAETIVELWASVFHVNVGEFPDLTVDRSADHKLKRDSSVSGMPDGDQRTPRTRESKKTEPVAPKSKAAAAAQSDIVVKMSFEDNRKTADFLSTGTPERSEKKKPKKPERFEDSAITPLQPDMMSYSAPASSSDQQVARKTSIDEAFRSLRNGDYQAASKIMMELARSGDTRAQYHLGEFYLMGTGLDQSNDKAKYWFRKAAAHGSLPARNKLADLEEPEGQTGCLGCAFVVFLVVVVLKFLSAII